MVVDGLYDGWGGGRIPLCVIAPGCSGQHDNGGGTIMAGRGNGSVNVTERDYIGLGLAPLATSDGPLMDAPMQLDEAKMDCSRVELTLGLRPPHDKAKGAVPATQEEQYGGTSSMEELPGLSMAVPEQLVVSGGGPSPFTSQSFWQQSFRLKLSSDHQHHPTNQVEAGYPKSIISMPTSKGQAGMADMARFTIPVPKVSTVPAKRPYVEAAGEKGATSEPAMPSGTFVGGMMYVWNGEVLPHMAIPNVVVGGGARQQSQSSYDQGPSYGKSVGSSPFGRPIIAPPLLPPPQFKVPLTPASAKSPKPSDPSSSAQAIKTCSQPEFESKQNRCKDPVVGWPPVRAFRKNTLNAASNRLSADDPLAKTMGGGDAQEQISGGNGKNAFFVKAKLDGVRICRKVDLTAYNSYEGLKSALQEMFQGFVSGNSKLDLLHGYNYVVTYEDKDGDCLLVGDMPWNMFMTSTVKSLRIMKAMDAVAIGDKGSSKLKAQESGKP